MTSLTADWSCFEEVFSMQLTMAEKREFIERITVLIKDDVLTREDRDAIYRICLVACSRELARMEEA